MREKRNRWAYLLVSLLLCFPGAPDVVCAFGSGPAENAASDAGSSLTERVFDGEQAVEPKAGAGLYSSALTPELERLVTDVGYIHQNFSSTITDYQMTLAPQETEFCLTAWPVERESPPTMEIWLEAEPWCTLSMGQPSRAIPVAAGQSRSVTVRSTSHTGGVVRDYTIEVYRPAEGFAWRLEEERETGEGVRLLPVTLYAPAGMQLKTLSFALGFDPQLLSLSAPEGAATEKLSECVTAVDGFLYENPAKGYFSATSPQLSNENGLLRVSYGAKNNIVGKRSYTASETGALLTVWFQIRGELTADSLWILESENAPVKGFSAMDGSGRVLQCAGLASVKGLPEEPDVPDPPTPPDSPGVPEPDPSVTGSAITLAGLLGAGAEIRDGKGVLETEEGVITLTTVDGSVEDIEEGTTLILTAEAKAGKQFVCWTQHSLPGLRAARFSAGDPADLAGDPAKLTANPLTVQAQKGMSYTAVYETASAEETTRPVLGVLELERESLPGPAGLDQRFLVYTDGDGARHFGFQPGEIHADGSREPGVFAYEVYLFPGEEAELILQSSGAVTGITASGVSAEDGSPREMPLVSSQTGGGGEPQDQKDLSWWEDREGQRLKLTLRDEDKTGTVTLTLGNAEGKTTAYTLTLHRVEKRPAVTVFSSGGAVTAVITDAEMRSATFSLLLTPEKAASLNEAEVWSDIQRSLSGSGIVVSDVRLTEPEAAGTVTGPGLSSAKELRVALDTKGAQTTENEGGAPVLSTQKRPVTLRLFEGSMADILGAGEAKDNVIGDARFGGLFGTTALTGGVRLTGTIFAYDASKLPEVTLYEMGTGAGAAEKAGRAAPLSATVVPAPDQTGFGLKRFTFTAVLAEGTEYTMGVTKDRHTACTVSGIALTEDGAARPLRLYAGDLDGDGWVSAFDADALAFHLGRGERATGEKVRYDLDGDGGETIFDLDLLTSQDNYGGRDRTLEWSAVREGGVSR